MIWYHSFHSNWLLSSVLIQVMDINVSEGKCFIIKPIFFCRGCLCISFCNTKWSYLSKKWPSSLFLNFLLHQHNMFFSINLAKVLWSLSFESFWVVVRTDRKSIGVNNHVGLPGIDPNCVQICSTHTVLSVVCERVGRLTRRNLVVRLRSRAKSKFWCFRIISYWRYLRLWISLHPNSLEMGDGLALWIPIGCSGAQRFFNVVGKPPWECWASDWGVGLWLPMSPSWRQGRNRVDFLMDCLMWLDNRSLRRANRTLSSVLSTII